MTAPTPPTGVPAPGSPVTPPRRTGPSALALSLGAAGLVVVAVVGTLLITRDSSQPAASSTTGSSVVVSEMSATTSGTGGMDMSGMEAMGSMGGDGEDGIVIRYQAPEGGPVIVTTMADGEVDFNPPASVSPAPAPATAPVPAADGTMRTVQFVVFGRDGAADVTITTPDGTRTLNGVVPSSDPNSAPAERTVQVAAGQRVSMTATRTAGSGSTNCAIIVDGQNVDLSLATGDGAVARCEATV